jgi:gamma-glutamylcyclotransferase (GGCT)/AIG2-like uncharacterized protein YtfP
MQSQSSYNEKLFSYGTLQYEAVQIATFGRKLNGTQDILNSYRLAQLQINDPNVIATSGESIHPILIHTGVTTDEVIGTVFDISQEELQLADQYEVADYKRVCVQLHSGTSAWVYISR